MSERKKPKNEKKPLFEKPIRVKMEDLPSDIQRGFAWLKKHDI